MCLKLGIVIDHVNFHISEYDFKMPLIFMFTYHVGYHLKWVFNGESKHIYYILLNRIIYKIHTLDPGYTLIETMSFFRTLIVLPPFRYSQLRCVVGNTVGLASQSG